MFCTNCGKNINNEKVCPFCGTTQELYNMQNQAASFVNQPISRQEFIQNQLSISEDSVIPENLKFGAVEKDKEFNVMALIFGRFWQSWIYCRAYIGAERSAMEKDGYQALS